MAKIFVALPVLGGFYPQMIQSLLSLIEKNPGEHEYKFDIRFNESLISRVRNAQATAFLASDCEYFLSIDADLSFGADAIDRLVRHGRDIVAAPYVVKTLPPRWAIQFLDGDLPTYVSGITEVKYVSAGFCLVKRAVFERLSGNSPSYTLSDVRQHGFYIPFVHDDMYLGEDWAFCQRAREQGFKIYADFDVKLVHYGLAPYWMKEIEGKLPGHSMAPLAAGFDAMAASLDKLGAGDLVGNFTKGVSELLGKMNTIQTLAKDLGAPPKRE